EDTPVSADGAIDITAWISRIQNIIRLSEAEQTTLLKACKLAESVEANEGDKLTGWGEGYTTYHAGLDMAEILADLQTDGETLVAALLYRSVRENKLSDETVSKEFGQTIAGLIDG